ncbi:MAG: hypothetical protein ACK55O_08970, partial [Phycisphaerales bacterium]
SVPRVAAGRDSGEAGVYAGGGGGGAIGALGGSTVVGRGDGSAAVGPGPGSGGVGCCSPAERIDSGPIVDASGFGGMEAGTGAAVERSPVPG